MSWDVPPELPVSHVECREVNNTDVISMMSKKTFSEVQFINYCSTIEHNNQLGQITILSIKYSVQMHGRELLWPALHYYSCCSCTLYRAVILSHINKSVISWTLNICLLRQISGFSVVTCQAHYMTCLWIVNFEGHFNCTSLYYINNTIVVREWSPKSATLQCHIPVL